MGCTSGACAGVGMRSSDGKPIYSIGLRCGVYRHNDCGRGVLPRILSAWIFRDKIRGVEEMVIEKNYEGAWVISAIVDGYSVTRRYYGYTKQEARQLFKAYCRGLVG